MSAPPMRATPNGAAWPGAATDQAQWPADIPSEMDPDYPDRGRGWSVAARPMQEEAPPYVQRMTNSPRRTGGAALSEVGIALFGSMARTTFNLTLLAIILAILAIPVSIGLGKLALLRPSAPAVAAAKTPHPVATPYAGYASYQNGLFSISYPNGWSKGTASRVIDSVGNEQETDFTSPDKTSIFAVGMLAAVPSDQSRPTLQAVASVFPAGNTANYITIGVPAVGKTVDGQAAIEIDFTCDYIAPGQHLVNLQGTVLLRSQGLTTYMVGFVAPRSQFASVQGQFFGPMLASLRLDA
jgi:hypothetical protein